MAAGLKESGSEVELSELKVVKKKSKPKNAEIELQPVQKELSAYDLLVIGSPVFGLSPKRKIAKAVEAYLRQCSGIEGKKVAVFLTCFGIPGTALKKISGIIQSRGAIVADSLVVAYLLSISAKQFEEAKEFGKRIAEPQGATQN